MDFHLTDEQQALKDLAHEFAVKEMIPASRQYDETEEFPLPVVKKAFDLGLMFPTIPQEYGGGGIGHLDSLLIVEELAWGDAGINPCIGINQLALSPILIAGTEEQRKKFITPICREMGFASLCLTEAGSGSDAASLSTTAARKNDAYVLNGTKRFITNGGVANLYLVFATTDKDQGHKGICCFAVPRDLPGVSVGKKEEKMGQRASNTTEVVFDDVPVPKENLVGREGEGFKIVMKVFDHSRPGVGVIGVGVARRALEEAMSYAKLRVQFGQPIAEFQAIQFMLADIAMEIEAARLVSYEAAWGLDKGIKNSHLAAMAKTLGADIAVKATTDAVQILGGYGYTKDYIVEKLFRDAKVIQIYEGTTQIQRLLIARSLVL